MPTPYDLPDVETLELLHRFLMTRFDALADYLRDEEGVHAHSVHEDASELVAEVARMRRWAAVPTGLRPRIAHEIKMARVLWSQEGHAFDQVKRYVALTTPEDLRGFVLKEAYRDAPPEPVPFLAGADGGPRRIGTAA